MRCVLVPSLVAILAACQPIAGPEAAVPEGPLRVIAAEARASQVVLRLSDGTRCLGERPEGVQTGWSGVTVADCGYSLPYTVAFRQGGSAQRFTIEDARGTLTPEGAPGPRAEIFVTDVDGQRRLFVTPLGRSTRFRLAES